MDAPRIEQLFDFNRFPHDGVLLFLLALYFPVGLCLLVLRIFVGVHVFLVSCALPRCSLRRFILRVMCSVLGIYVKQRSSWLRDRNVKLYISNHVTPFDHNVINIVTSCNTPVLGSSSGFLCWARGFLELDTTSSHTELAGGLQQYCSDLSALPLLFFPEEDTTNGRRGLLKFSSWPFTVTDTVQPVALTARRPLLAVSTAESSWVTELLWILFVPFTVYQVRWLSPLSRQDGEPPQDFANKVQELIAKELGLASTQITRADKAEHIKRKRHVAPQIRSTNVDERPRSQRSPGLLASISRVDDVRIVGMAQKVKEVLPDIPLSIIMRDLVQTNCVDTTITNLLEDGGDATAEVSSGTASGEVAAGLARGPTSYTTRPATPPWSAAKTFGKSPVDRHMSLQERKEALYEYARRRYIEKHGLNRENNM
ncbi:lipid droplet-regulating VLDL assembly factor AUP1 [Scleropages formosus]|uniref:Lipid droplet-regulating VLDL assembly factor AUP1 n=1 Tax=Scleropages formosus TaxID=113540 RepID=A0A8C9QZ88_SCLFO|nr:ancient ubiquitous protein 1-like [Scleropages formosus]